jgi:hypothetical protein
MQRRRPDRTTSVEPAAGERARAVWAEREELRVEVGVPPGAEELRLEVEVPPGERKPAAAGEPISLASVVVAPVA